MLNEPDTCRKFVLPKLREAGWDDVRHHIREQWSFTDGRIVVRGGKPKRLPQKRADYVLRYTRDFPIAVVEAKAAHKHAADGLDQAKQYAEILGLKFAYSTNGAEIIEFDFTLGTERRVEGFPTPDELWGRYRGDAGIDDAAAERVLAPSEHSAGRSPRYYQEIAINRAVEAISSGRRRALLTMATGTGKTVVAFQICWKLWNARWNLTGEHRRPRILYLADRTFLVDDPKDRYFWPLGAAVTKIEGGANLGREMYFATYQALAGDAEREGVFRQFPPNFFDLVIVDECHRGSAREDSVWRDILEYFKPAAQLGMTATPSNEETKNTYQYFGAPLYTYSLRQGIEDGFLAPFRVHRVITSWDAAGWRPTKDEVDRYGRAIPDDEYQVRDFGRVVALRARTEAIARNLSDFMREHGRMDKTMVFCVDQEHAAEMRQALTNLNSDLAREHPDYVCRVTADEGQLGKGHLGRFQDPERETPVILTTSQLLTTGVDAPSCRNIVLARVINSMTEFKQIIGRGTRIHEDSEKLFFNIIDYTGSATRLFADPAFDGDPAIVIEQPMDDEGKDAGPEQVLQPEADSDAGGGEVQEEKAEYEPGEPRKFYVDTGEVAIIGHLVYDLDANGKQIRVRSLTDYTQDSVRTLYTSVSELRNLWVEPERRQEIIERLEERGISFEELAAAAGQPDADPFDLLCHTAFNAPLRTRRERAERLRRDQKDFFDQYSPAAREILDELTEKYAEHGATQFKLPDVLHVPPVSSHGNIPEITAMFGGAERLREAAQELQRLLYAPDS